MPIYAPCGHDSGHAGPNREMWVTILDQNATQGPIDRDVINTEKS